MKDGDPFLTEELDLQRSKQRRLLRSIPDDLLGPRIAKFDVNKFQSDEGFLETELRGLADQEIERLGETLDEFVKIEPAKLVNRLLSDATPPRASDSFADMRPAVSRQALMAVPPNLDNEVQKTFVRLISLLSWADDLAGDYTDRRIHRIERA